MDHLEDDEPKKPSGAAIARKALVAVLALACAGGWIYTRWIVKKETLGGPCSYDMHCRTEAPRCLKQSTEGDGVCSRACDTDGDCAPEVKCVKVELDEYDERGRPLQGGYCFPQALLDARRHKKNGDAGTPSARSDSWLDVPEIPGQLEGEVAVDRGGTKTSFEVKGTLVRVVSPTKHGRTIVDTSTLRVYTVDDDKKAFSASQLTAGPGEVKVTKTEKKDTVADRSCEIWQLDEGTSSREVCVIKGAAFVDPTGRSLAAWEKELTVRGVFPLRVIENGKTKAAATKIDAHAMDPSLFAIPKTYKNLAAR
jgi:hypothetical protein